MCIIVGYPHAVLSLDQSLIVLYLFNEAREDTASYV